MVTQKRGTHAVWFHEDFPVHMEQQMAFAKKHCGMEYDQVALDRKFDYEPAHEGDEKKEPLINWENLNHITFKLILTFSFCI